MQLIYLPDFSVLFGGFLKVLNVVSFFPGKFFLNKTVDNHLPGSCELPQDLVQPFWRLLYTNIQTDKQNIVISI